MSQPAPPPFAPEKPIGGTGQPAPPETTPASYQNNPFYVALDGMSALFKYAKSVAIFLIAVSVIFGFMNFVSNLYDTMYPASSPNSEKNVDTSSSINEIAPGIAQLRDMEPSELLGVALIVGFVVFIVLVCLLVVGAIFKGIGDVTAAAVANEKTISLGQAFKTLMRRFPGYLGLIVLVGIKTFLWSLLFIIPGIIMAVRYSLAGTAFFARDMKITEAIRYSTTITKNGWTTLFASNGIFNIITLGLLSLFVTPSVQAIVFRQYDGLQQKGIPKPAAHWLSVLTTVLFFTFLSLAILLPFIVLLPIYMLVMSAQSGL